MATYDPKKVSISVGGKAQTGLAESFINVAKNSDNVTPKVGVKGDVAVAINADQSGVVTVTYLHTSASLPQIIKWANANKKLALAIKDANADGKMIINTNSAYIQKTPDMTRGKEVGEVAVAFLVPNVTPK